MGLAILMPDAYPSSPTHRGKSNWKADNQRTGDYRYGPRLSGTVICMAQPRIQECGFVLQQQIHGRMGLQGENV